MPKEHWSDKAIRAGLRLSGSAAGEYAGALATKGLISAEQIQIEQTWTQTPAEELYLHLNRLADLNSRWEAPVVDGLQFVVNGLLVADAALSEQKPMTMGKAALELVGSAAARSLPVVLPELFNAIQNLSELEHTMTAVGELAVIALGAAKIGMVAGRLFHQFTESRSHHAKNRKAMQNGKVNTEVTPDVPPNKDEHLLDLHRQGHKMQRELVSASKITARKITRHNKETEAVHPERLISQLPLPKSEPTPFQLHAKEVKEARAGLDNAVDAQVLSGNSNEDSDVPTFIRNLINNRK